MQESQSCFRCGFEFSSDPVVREEEVGHQAINGTLCYSCAINSVTACPSVFTIRATHDFHVTRFENFAWGEFEHQPVSTPRDVETLTSEEWGIVEAISTRSLAEQFNKIPRSDLTRDKVEAASLFDSPLGGSQDELLPVPGVAVISMDAVFAKEGDADRVTDQLSDKLAESEQAGLAQY
jgi:hypothetical protein